MRCSLSLLPIVFSSFMELRAERLTKDFDRRRAVDGLTFSFEGPGLIGYLGPNGAGKSTTLKLFSHLLRPTFGRALVNGRDVADDPVAALSGLSALVEAPDPYAHQTIREFLTFIGQLREIESTALNERIRWLSERLALEGLERRCGSLSRGHRQRVVLAAVLIPETPIVLLDEPTGSLDPVEAKRVRSLLLDLKRERLIFMSSHLLSEVASTCDRVAFLNHGKLILVDSVDAVRSRFSLRDGADGLEDAYLHLIQEGIS